MTLHFFSAVDRTREPDFFKRFLDEGNKIPDIIAASRSFSRVWRSRGVKRCSTSVAGSATTPSNSPDWLEAAAVLSASMSAKA